MGMTGLGEGDYSLKSDAKGDVQATPRRSAPRIFRSGSWSSSPITPRNSEPFPGSRRDIRNGWCGGSSRNHASRRFDAPPPL